MAKVPVVGIDLDGVLVNFSQVILGKFTLYTGVTYSRWDVTNYDFVKCLSGVTPSIMKSVFDDIQNSRGFWTLLQSTSPEAVEAARELAMFSHLYAVTARRECLVAQKRVETTITQSSHWLLTREIHCAGVLRCDHGEDKGDLLSAMGCEYFLDDSPVDYLSCIHSGVNAYLLDAPYNQDVDLEGDDFRRVCSVREFVDMVKEEIQ